MPNYTILYYICMYIQLIYNYTHTHTHKGTLYTPPNTRKLYTHTPHILTYYILYILYINNNLNYNIYYVYLQQQQQFTIYILLVCASCDLRNFNKNKQKIPKKYKTNEKYKKTKI